MRMRTVWTAFSAGLVACGGVSLPTGPTGPGLPADVAQVRLFDPRGTELTLHTGLVDDESLRVEVRLYAPDGRRLSEIIGGVELALRFTPDSLATSVPVPDQPLQRLVRPTSPSGASGSQTVALSFPGDGSMKSFGPFHVQVQPSAHGGVAQMRLFDSQNVEMTQHVPLVTNQTTRLGVRLYDQDGRRLTSVAGGAEISFRFDPTSIATATPVAQLPFWKDVTPTAIAGSEGGLFVSVLFLADGVTKTYGPIQVLVH